MINFRLNRKYHVSFLLNKSINFNPKMFYKSVKHLVFHWLKQNWVYLLKLIIFNLSAKRFCDWSGRAWQCTATLCVLLYKSFCVGTNAHFIKDSLKSAKQQVSALDEFLYLECFSSFNFHKEHSTGDLNKFFRLKFYSAFHWYVLK